MLTSSPSIIFTFQTSKIFKRKTEQITSLKKKYHTTIKVGRTKLTKKDNFATANKYLQDSNLLIFSYQL